MREINEAGIQLIKRFEGFRANTYPDIAGYLTIGFGHLVKSGEDFSSGTTESQALDLLYADLRRAEASVSRLINVPLTDNQFAALVSFTFNLGGAALQCSTLRRKINRGESTQGEWEKWCFVGGKKSKGLSKRRIAEAQLFQSNSK